jgi:hypothetical protein
MGTSLEMGSLQPRHAAIEGSNAPESPTAAPVAESAAARSRASEDQIMLWLADPEAAEPADE